MYPTSTVPYTVEVGNKRGASEKPVVMSEIRLILLRPKTTKS